MSKMGAVRATLIYLLVVLSLAIESEQLLSLFGGKSKEWLWEQLNKSLLDPDQLFECMKKVSGKKEVAIGGTNLEELIELSKISSEDCNDATYKEREDVYRKAETAKNVNVGHYCRDRLIKLIESCPKLAPEYQGKRINPPTSPDTVEYFRSLFKGFGSRILKESEIVDINLGYFYDVVGKRSGELKKNCIALKRSRKQSGVIRIPSEQSGANQSGVNLEGPIWDKAYSLCKMFLENIGIK